MSCLRRLGPLAALLLSALPVAAQTVSGTVVEEPGLGAVEGAVALLLGRDGRRVDSAVTDARGEFGLRAPAAGEYVLRVERLGYGPAQAVLRLPAGEPLRVRVEVAVEAVPLEQVVAETEAEPVSFAARRGFYERAQGRRGGGRFLTADDVSEYRGQRLGTVLDRVPGVELDCSAAMDVGIDSRCVLKMTRVTASIYDQACPVQYFVDGLRLGPAEFDINGLAPELIEGIEVYTGAAGLPPQFAGPYSRCGTIVLWTIDRLPD